MFSVPQKAAIWVYAIRKEQLRKLVKNYYDTQTSLTNTESFSSNKGGGGANYNLGEQKGLWRERERAIVAREE